MSHLAKVWFQFNQFTLPRLGCSSSLFLQPYLLSPVSRHHLNGDFVASGRGPSVVWLGTGDGSEDHLVAWLMMETKALGWHGGKDPLDALPV